MQHGVVALGQLQAAGLSSGAVAKRARRGRLHRVHRGVYAVGHASLTYRGRCMAAVLALSGTGGNRPPSGLSWGTAVVSHRSAAMLWGLLPPTAGTIHVSIRDGSGREPRRGICVHRRAALPAECVAGRYGIPVTAVAQTIADLKGEIPPAQWRRAIRQAEVLGLRTGLDEASDRTRSELEYLFLRLCEHHGLPKPEVNVRIGHHLVDFLWRDQRLIVETDGYQYHRGQAAFENDRTRDLELRASGYDVLRLTHRQVTESPTNVAAVLARKLAAVVP